jgi:LacI family transcriptional regulator
MILASSGSDPKKEAELLESMVDMRVEGVILCSGVSNMHFLADYKKYNTPLVAIGRGADIDYSDASISGNHVTGARIATQYLLGGGNTHILYIDGHPEYSGVMQKRQGFIQAMREAGRPVDETCIFTKEHSYEHGFSVVNHLLDEGRPVSAIFAGSDLIAVGVVQALVARGVKIPDAVEVIGFDNIVLSEMVEPRLTTMHKPHADMARRAVEMLLQVVDGSIGELRHITVDPRLLVRGTTRPRVSSL